MCFNHVLCFKRRGMVSIRTLKANDYKTIERHFFTLSGFHHSDPC